MEDSIGRIIKALEAAEQRARRILIEELGEEASRFTIAMRVDYDDTGVSRLVIDVEASRPRHRWVERAVSRAVREARKTFEEVLVGLSRSPRGSS